MSTTTSRHETTNAADPALPIIVITREFDAPPDRVFRAYTDPELVVQWLGPRRLTMQIEEYDARTHVSYRLLHIDEDGTEYGFHGACHEVRQDERIVQTFTVPAIPGGRSDTPMDLGVMRLRHRFALKVGEPAPAFEVTTIEGKKLAVPGDFQGKYLLVDFGTMWDRQSGIQITRLNDVNQKFGKNPRFNILSLTFAADNPETRKHIADKGEVWPQAIVGPLSNPISLAYAVDDENVPVTILIGPDGKIVANELYYDKISKAVGEALDRPAK